MPCKIEWTEDALSDLRNLERTIVRRILKKLEWFSKYFDNITPEPLSGDMSGLFKLRVGDWRVIYSLQSNKIVIHSVGHRRDIYKF